MTKRRRRILIISLALLLLGAIAAPFVRRELVLRQAKERVRRIYARLPPEVIETINSTPAWVDPPLFNPLSHPIEAVDFGGFAVRVLKPDVHSVVGDQLKLIYPRFEVIIRELYSQATSDSYARTLGFKNYFELSAASYQTRLLELDAQKDLDALHLFTVLLSAKPQLNRCVERFEREDLRGFILLPMPGTKRYTAETYIVWGNAGCGIWFTDTGGLTMADIHEFLGVLRFELSPAINR